MVAISWIQMGKAIQTVVEIYNKSSESGRYETKWKSVKVRSFAGVFAATWKAHRENSGKSEELP